MDKFKAKLAEFAKKIQIKKQEKLLKTPAKLNEQCGYLFRAGSITVDCSVLIPKTINCDVPYLAAYTENQKLTGTKDQNKRKSLPEETVKMESLEFGIFDGDFPRILRMRISDKDGIPDFVEKWLAKGKGEGVDEVPFVELDEKFKMELPDQSQVTYANFDCIEGELHTKPRPRELNCSDGQVVSKEFTFQDGGKIDVNVTYKLQTPKCTNTIVTDRFKELFDEAIANPEAAIAGFKSRYPDMQNCRILLIPGLFTEYYPGYFSKNVEWLKDNLGFDVKVSEIKTSVGLQKNADDLTAEIKAMAAETPDKKIIAIGHSKGSVDLATAVLQHPELIDLLYGHVAIQAPYNGSYMIEWVMEHKSVNSVAGEVVTKLWGGEVNAYQDLCYAERQKNHEKALYDGNKLPTVCMASYADFALRNVDNLAEFGGVVSMKFAADTIKSLAGALSDVLVAQNDSRLPGADCVLSSELMHSEPAMQWPETKSPCGPLTHSLVALLFEKVQREKGTTQ